ncbi:MAG: hypothetical protein IJA60_02855 [Clostridia bacterium]|nr:hypothetical protein [Clostridia bacterium]
MKKFLIATALVLVLCLSLVGCGTKDGVDYVFDSLEGIEDSFNETGLGAFVGNEADTVKLSVSAADLSGLANYGLSLPDIKNVSAALYGDIKNVVAAQVVSAEIGGEKAEITLIENKENLFASSSLFNGAYSMPVSAIAEELEYQMGISFEELMNAVEQSSNTSKELLALDEKYDNEVKKLFGEHVEFTVEKDGKNVNVSFVITEKEFDAIITALAEVMANDKDLEKLIKQLDPEYDMAMITDALPDMFDDASFEITAKLTVQKKNDVLISADVNIAADDAVVTLTYDYDVKTEDFTLKAGDADNAGNFTITGKSGAKNEYTYEISAESYGEEMFTAAFAIAKDEFTVTVSAEDVNVEFICGYAIKKNSITLTPKKVTVNGFGVDLEGYGLTIAIENGVKLPGVPKGATEVEDIDAFASAVAEEVQTNLMKFMQ